MTEAGMGDAHRKKILGHALEGMDSTYVNLGDDALTSAMDVFTEWIDSRDALRKCFQNVSAGAVFEKSNHVTS